MSRRVIQLDKRGLTSEEKAFRQGYTAALEKEFMKRIVAVLREYKVEPDLTVIAPLEKLFRGRLAELSTTPPGVVSDKESS